MKSVQAFFSWPFRLKYKIETREEQMDTKIINDHSIEEAIQLLQAGQVVAFPTETVYGIGANALDEHAVAKIFTAKGRPSDNPLNVLVPNTKALYYLAKNVPTYVEKLMEVFSPGPITYVLQSAGKVAENVTANLSTIGVRIPNHPVALNILHQTGLALAAPSANLSGRPSPTAVDHVIHDLMGKVSAIVDGGSTNVGLESTVVDCTGEVPTILRSGFITVEDIRRVVGACNLAPSIQMPSNKYKHYQPEVPLILARTEGQFQDIVRKKKAAGNRIGVIISLSFDDINVEKIFSLGTDEVETARNLYDVLRAIKKSEVDVVISAPFPSDIVMDRLASAATKIV